MLVVLVIYSYANRYGSTPAFRDAKGEVIPGSIAEMRRVNLGGVEQSVIIRGKSAKAPILIWLHGGPGTVSNGLMRRNNAALENHFLVVYWTQRGTGRSYNSQIPSASINMAQFVGDLDALIAKLKSRFQKRKVVLVGHSFGTSLGVAYAQAHPENVAAFVGVSQVVNAREGERRSYQFTLDEAKRRGKEVAIKELTTIGPPPYPVASIIKQRKWLNEFGGGWKVPRSMPSLMWESFQASEITWLDGANMNAGQTLSLNAMAAENAKVDWLTNATQFQMPVFILAGRFDRNTDAALQHEYFVKITAPYKQFKWFENSAHSPPFEEPESFNNFLIESVLPLVNSNSAAHK